MLSPRIQFLDLLAASLCLNRLSIFNLLTIPTFFWASIPTLFGPEFGVLEIGTPCSQYAHFVKQPLKENIDTCVKRTHVFSSFRHLPGPKYPQEMVRVLSDLWGEPLFFLDYLESHFQVASHLVSGCQPWLVGSLRLLTPNYILSHSFLSFLVTGSRFSSSP